MLPAPEGARHRTPRARVPQDRPTQGTRAPGSLAMLRGVVVEYLEGKVGANQRIGDRG